MEINGSMMLFIICGYWAKGGDKAKGIVMVGAGIGVHSVFSYLLFSSLLQQTRWVRDLFAKYRFSTLMLERLWRGGKET